MIPLIMSHTPDAVPTNMLLTPDALGRALRAIVAGDRRGTSFLAAKEGLLPPEDLLARLLEELGPAARILLHWLQPAAAKRLALPAATTAGLRWMKLSNRAATREACAAPAWWEEWRDTGWPAAREALGWLLAIEPPCAEDAALAWCERHLVSSMKCLRANSLLLLAAGGEEQQELLTLARDGFAPAIHALALLPADDPEIMRTLCRLHRAGSRPVREAARLALSHLARRHGFPDMEEFERQHLLAIAWEDALFGGHELRTHWLCGSCRLHVEMRHGRTVLEVRDALGLLPRIPDEIRHSTPYREARDAQRHLQQRYRVFKPYLEEAMLHRTPIAAGQFRHLYTHPVFAHIADRLLWQLPDGQVICWSALERWEYASGNAINLLTAPPALTLTVVHPITLANDALTSWQTLLAERRMIQPFKQLFREMYAGDSEHPLRCTRFAGRAIAPSRAYALLRAAGFAPGNGTARRDWPGGVTALLIWAEGASGRDLFGPHRRDAVTTGDIYFTQHDEELPLAAVDPIIISESLRAADLLTTQAAVGDAELTSRETLLLRTAMLRQLARSFQVTNIAAPEDGRYALVLGARADYRVNLANGTVMLEPEGRQLIMPPPDPRWQLCEDADLTAEIITTALTLAHDEEIDDLTFLAQLPRR